MAIAALGGLAMPSLSKKENDPTESTVCDLKKI